MMKRDFQPVPQGDYLPAVRHGDLIFTSGMTPRSEGKLLYSGKILVENQIDSYREPVHLATLNALTAAQNCLEKNENIAKVLQLIVYLNAEEGFTEHAKIADYASQLIRDRLGDQWIGARVAIGVATLPSNAPVEIALVAEVL
jgi:enamine deaminase RidA (YjgF/YER057c/UK114 family)